MKSGTGITAMIERLVQAGFALHWLHPRSKRPVGDEWASKPVATLIQLRQTYRKDRNVGVRLGKWSKVNDLYLHIIDFDIRSPEMVLDAKAELKKQFPELNTDRAPTVISGSGGESRHFYFLTDRPFPPKKFAHSESFTMVWDENKNRDVKKWDWELHLLGTGAQAAIPPSIHPDTGKPYKWLRPFDWDMLELGLSDSIPSEAVARLVAERETPVDPERQQPLGLSLDEIKGLIFELPTDWYDDRDSWFKNGMAIHHETGGSEEGFELFDEWSKQSKKYDAKDTRRVWKSFKNKAEAPFRMASIVAVVKDIRIEREFEDLDDDEFDDLSADFEDELLGPKPKKAAIKLAKEQVEKDLGKDAPPKIKRMNKRHAVARVSSKTVVIDFHDDGTVTYGSVGDLHNFYENDRVPKDDTTEPLSKNWMRSKHRRTYPKGIVFAPNREVEGAYNHWQGFSVTPDETKSCELFLEHVYEVICDRNDELYEYVLDYLAHMIQKPEEKPGVALVLKGKKGAGKDTIAEYFGKLIANHYITIWNQEQFTGKFNQHQERCILLHVQEGFWAGDKRQEGALKATITSENAMIEPKGMNAFPIKSVLRIFISSNEKWVVPATEDERRFCVMNVSNRYLGNHKYFEALRNEMNGDGPAALLAFLADRNIKDFQVRKVPNTQGLAEQKVEGLKNVERWWHGLLEDGSMEGFGHRAAIGENQWLDGPVNVDKNDFRDGYSRWLRPRRFDGEEVGASKFTCRLKAMLPSVLDRQLGQADARYRVFVLPDLKTCRREFEQFVGSKLVWPDVSSPKTESLDDDFDDLSATVSPVDHPPLL